MQARTITPDEHREAVRRLNNAAVSCIQVGEQEKALSLLSEALEESPLHPEAVYNWRMLQWQRGAATDIDAVESLMTVARALPGRWEPRYLLGLVHMARKDAESARSALSEAIRLAPGEVMIQEALEWVRRGEGLWPRRICELQAHPRGIKAAAFTPDATRLLLAGSTDQKATLWNISDGKLLSEYALPDESGPWDIDLSPDGKYALMPSLGRCNLWDLETRHILRTFQWPQKLLGGIRVSGWIAHASFHPDGKHALTATNDGEVTLWDIQTGKGERILETSGKRLCEKAALSQDGSFLVMANPTTIGGAYLLYLPTGKLVVRSVHTNGLTSVAVSRAGVLTGSYDGSACLWNPATSQILRTFTRRKPHYDPLYFRASGRYALTEHHARGTEIWDLSNGRVLRTLESGSHYDPLAFFLDTKARIRIEEEVSLNEYFPKPSESAVTSVALSADGRYAATGTHGGWVHLWACASGVCLRSFEKFPSRIDHMAFSPDGAYLMATGPGIQYESPCLARVWDIRGVSEPGFTPAAAREGSGSAFPDLERQVEACVRARHWEEVRNLLRTAEALPGYDRNPALVPALMKSGYYAQSATYPITLPLWAEGMGPVAGVCVSGDGRTGLTAGEDGMIRLWNLGSGRPEAAWQSGAFIRSASFSADGRHVLVRSVDHRAHVFDARKATRVFTAGDEAHPAEVSALSRDGRFLAAAGRGEVSFWDLRNGEKIAGCCVEGNVLSVAFSEGRVLIGTEEGDVYRWKAPREDPALRLRLGPVTSVAVFRSVYLDTAKDVALACTRDGTARLWDLEGGCLGIARDHAGNVLSVAACFQGEGSAVKFAVTASDDGNAYLWNLETGYCERRVPNPTHRAEDVAYCARLGRTLAIGKEGQARLWSLQTLR